MKGNKIIAVLVVMAMVLSTMIVLNTLDVKFVEEAGAVPGVTEFGYPSNVTTKDLIYNPDAAVDIDVNTTGLTSAGVYYLYYPVYTYASGAGTYNLTWSPYRDGPSQKSITVGSPGTDETLEDIYLNRSGLWILNSTLTNGVINCNDATNFSNTVDKWFWVNTSDTYVMTITYTEDLNYGENQTIDILVENEEGSGAASWLDVRRDNNTEPVIFTPKYQGSGDFQDIDFEWLSDFQWAGNYSAFGFIDMDETSEQPPYQLLGVGYNNTFGSNPSITADYYSFDLCGPWDPPEFNTTKQIMRVYPGEPTTSIPTANRTMYWGFDGAVSISVRGYDGANLSHGLQVKVFNPDDEDVTANLTIDTSMVTINGYLNISNKDAVVGATGGWGRNTTIGGKYGENGTWQAYLYNNTDGDTGALEYTQEWNTTVEWEVEKAPGLQFKWVDDDDMISSDNNDGLITSVPDNTQQPLNISFQLVSSTHGYYGAGANTDLLAPSEKGENITLSGDALFTGTLDKIPGVIFDTNTWYVPIIPLMNANGGEITIYANWKDEGSITETLTIGGDDLNGSIVTISPTEFIIDQNVTITVTVTGPTGYPYPNADVSLYWVNDSGGLQGLINNTAGGGTTSGEYTFIFNATQQTMNQTQDVTGTAYDGPWGTIMAPRNISAYVDLHTVGYGYAKATMKPQSDFKVTVSKGTIMAGERTEFSINVSIVNSSGGTTGWPTDKVADNLQFYLINESGGKITLDAAFGTIRSTDLIAINNSINERFLKPGTYSVYASNNTHNSVGNNATLVIKAVDVTCDKEEFIWNYDENTSAVFTVKYDGELINGTLTLYNITDAGDYNRTWVNESNDPSGNASIDLDIVNGVATLSNITAEFLPGSKAQENITYMFKPDTSNAASAKANGIVPVKIPNVATEPEAIPFDKKTSVKITVTGRDTPLEDVFVSIFVPGLTEQNGSTNSIGEKEFSFTPLQTGNVVIKIENRTSETVIRVTSWELYMYVPISADEADTFVVTVRNETITGDVIEGATVTFNGETYTTASDGTATIDSLTGIKVDTDETITATLEGYAPASDTIKIINKPELEITIDQTPDDKGKYSSPVDIYVSDDDGNLITAATVTFGDQVLTTINGKATITVESETTGTIGATKTGFAPAVDVSVTIKPAGIPGFELLTLIAAIGVAFILLRRRRH